MGFFFLKKKNKSHIDIRMFNLTGNRWIHDPNKDLQEQTFGVFLTLYV